MVKHYLKIVYIVLIFFGTTIAQTNVNLVGALNNHSSLGYSDIWGYVDTDGTEYAIMGVYNGTSFISLADPANPVEVGFISGPSSIWRDIKTHSHYAYITTEGGGAGEGLQIVDLSDLPNSVTLSNTYDDTFDSAHDVYIDNGYAYVVGTSGVGGMHILDLTDPVNPVETAYYTTSGYIHDVYVWNDTAVAAAANSYDLVDLTNKSTPTQISESIEIPGIYAHAGWMTEDKRYFYATDEFNQRDIIVYDLIDRSTWDVVVPSWQVAENTVVHNLFIQGNYAHISYYESGYVVLDISDPENPTQVAQYDTYPSSNNAQYNGLWGCYPFLPSGNVIVSDMQTGLHVLDFTLDNIVPVELLSFTGSVLGNEVRLSWSTATETNNHGFEIERSKDGANWNVVGFTKGNGNSTTTINYSFIDQSPVSGITNYRLKQIDLDGTFEYSSIVMVENNLAEKFKLSQNYPNPFNPETTISFSIAEASNVELRVYDITGKLITTLVNEYKDSGNYEVVFGTRGNQNLASGIYFYHLKTDKHSQVRKMQLLK